MRPRMTGSADWLSVRPDGIWLAVKTQPRASRSEVVGPVGAELRVRVTAPPVDAAANEALTRLLADTLGCRRNQVEIVRGHTSRHKVVAVRGVGEALVRERLGRCSGEK